MRYLDTQKPRLFAHRGASGQVPENTLEAFAAGLDAGATLLEMDVHATRDGEIVVLHDATLDRTTDGSGPVAECTLEDLRVYDAGATFAGEQGDYPFRGRGLRVPTLTEVLERFPDTPINVEIKQLDPPIEDVVFDLIDRHEARNRVLIAAGDASIMARARGKAGDMLSGFSAAEIVEFHTRCLADNFAGYEPPGFALQVPREYAGIEVVTPGFVERAHELGIEVHVWTINDPDEMNLLLDLGVDGLMSDYPSRLRETVERRGG